MTTTTYESFEHYCDGRPIPWARIPRVREAIHSLIANTDLTPEEISMIRRYLHYWINAPCWQQYWTQCFLNTLGELDCVASHAQSDTELMEVCETLFDLKMNPF